MPSPAPTNLSAPSPALPPPSAHPVVSSPIPTKPGFGGDFSPASSYSSFSCSSPAPSASSLLDAASSQGGALVDLGAGGDTTSGLLEQKRIVLHKIGLLHRQLREEQEALAKIDEELRRTLERDREERQRRELQQFHPQPPTPQTPPMPARPGEPKVFKDDLVGKDVWPLSDLKLSNT